MPFLRVFGCRSRVLDAVTAMVASDVRGKEDEAAGRVVVRFETRSVQGRNLLVIVRLITKSD